MKENQVDALKKLLYKSMEKALVDDLDEKLMHLILMETKSIEIAADLIYKQINKPKKVHKIEEKETKKEFKKRKVDKGDLFKLKNALKEVLGENITLLTNEIMMEVLQYTKNVAEAQQEILKHFFEVPQKEQPSKEGQNSFVIQSENEEEYKKYLKNPNSESFYLNFLPSLNLEVYFISKLESFFSKKFLKKRKMKDVFLSHLFSIKKKDWIH